METKTTTNTVIDCTRRIQFCAGHRVMGHENKCAHPHGHNYVVELFAQMNGQNENVDPIGRVVDFSVLKDRVGGWIDQHWDHGFILHENDTCGLYMLESFDRLMEKDQRERKLPLWKGCKRFLLPYNPTAENLAHYLLTVVGPLTLGPLPIRLTKVVVHETENCKATASLSPTHMQVCTAEIDRRMNDIRQSMV